MDVVNSDSAADVPQADVGQKGGLFQRDYLDLLTTRRAPGEGRAAGASDGNDLMHFDGGHGSLPHERPLLSP